MEDVCFWNQGLIQTPMGSPEGSRVTQQVLDADTPLSELAENNELELTLVVRLPILTNKSHDGRNPAMVGP